jgi:peptide-methionine (R)-S-oxide reductase
MNSWLKVRNFFHVCTAKPKTAPIVYLEHKKMKMINNTDDNFPIKLSEEEWKQKLDDEQYRVLRQKGTERPFTGTYDLHFKDGEYLCAGCGNVLFKSGSKFDSGCGWPAFYQQAEKGKVVEHVDRSFGMTRTEVLCGNCGGHLGHVFPDGPRPTGMRYCINSASLTFEPEKP